MHVKCLITVTQKVIILIATAIVIIVVQSLSHVQLFATPWIAAHQASLSFTISQRLLILTSFELMMPSNHLILLPPSPPALSFSQHQSLFQLSQLSASSGRSLGASASASVLPMNIQSWFPLGLTGLISLLSKGPSGVLSSTTIWKHQFFGAQPSLYFNSHICTHYWKNHSFDYRYLCHQSDVSAF